MDQITLKLIGASALLMHSDKFSDPLNPATRAHKTLTSKRTKTDEDYVAIARSEWEGGLYHNDEIGPYMPTQNIRSAIIDGGKLNKLGANIKRSVLILEDKSRLEYKGPRDVESMWTSGRFHDVRSVVVSRGRVMRYRPKFEQWSLTITLTYDPKVIEREQLIACARNAGTFIGIGDFRPNKGGQMGRFSVEVVQ
jgi:hypothetical protein